MSRADIEPVARVVMRTLRAAGVSERAARDKLYHKSNREHWGLSLPQIDAVLGKLDADLDGAERLQVARRLWREPVFDVRIAAVRLLRSKRRPADAQLWRFLSQRMSDLDGWAIADNFADVAGRCLIANEALMDEIEAFADSSLLWTRRASLVFTLPIARTGRDPERALAVAARHVPDREWFIQKAIGWWLRELSKRNPERVRRFLAEHGAGMKAFARREAEKHLD